MPMIGRSIGRGVTKSIAQGMSAGGNQFGGPANIDFSAASALSGAMTAATLKTAISVSGSPGRCSLLALLAQDATSRTLRLKVTIDGVVVFDATTNAITNSSAGIFAAGYYDLGGAKLYPGNDLVWGYQFLVEIASSLTETDKAKVYFKYQVEG